MLNLSPRLLDQLCAPHDDADAELLERIARAESDNGHTPSDFYTRRSQRHLHGLLKRGLRDAD